MRKYHSDLCCSLSPSACILAAMMVFLLPLRWILSAVLAALFHEFCHALAVFICGGRIQKVSIGGRGAVMHADGLSSGKTIFCVLAGPIGSLALVAFIRWIPRIAFCALFQGVYNLLPVYPLDGGRILRCLLNMKNRP